MTEHRPYAELDHPADLLLEIWGPDLPGLFANALFALYDHVAELAGFQGSDHRTIEADGTSVAETLRALLAEALYCFANEGFVATKTTVTVDTKEDGSTHAVARLDGEKADRLSHTLLSEVKAVTYHRLSVELTPDGDWKATVLLDI